MKKLMKKEVGLLSIIIFVLKNKINEPVDFSALVAKDYIGPILLNKPSSQTNRIDLLYETLKKQNLI